MDPAHSQDLHRPDSDSDVSPFPKPAPPSLLFPASGERATSSPASTSSEIPAGRSGGDSPREREKCVGRLDRVRWGFTSVIGRRREMEDAVAIVPGFISTTCREVGGCVAPASSCSGQIFPLHFFGVYDGHGGSQVARFCAERMHRIIVEEWEREENDGYKWDNKWEGVFSRGFKRADEQVLREAVANDMVGSTAVVALLSQCQIIVSNCGDSRAVLCRGTGTVPLSVDHKPDRDDELMRIEQEGGRVINWYGARVLGVLAMSRSIGDHYMRPYVIPVPEITFTTRTDEDECLILASDGLWEVVSNDEVGEVACRLLRRQRRNTAPGGVSPAQFVADNLRQVAIGRNSSDNISIIVVDLKSRIRRQPKS